MNINAPPLALGKRARTAERLLDAAVMLFARDGFEATSVLDITKEAGVANGTFYNYFNDKSQIVDAIYQRVTETLVVDIIEALDRLSQPAEQVALGTIWFLDAVSRDAQWGSMLAGMLEQDTPFREVCRGNIGRYVASGVSQGCFAVANLPNLIDFNVGLLIGAIRLRIDSGPDDPTDIALEAADLQLRMLGMRPEEAHAIPLQAKLTHGAQPPPRRREI